MLNDDLRHFVDEAVEAGKSGSPSEMVAGALKNLNAREQHHQAKLTALAPENRDRFGTGGAG